MKSGRGRRHFEEDGKQTGERRGGGVVKKQIVGEERKWGIVNCIC